MTAYQTPCAKITLNRIPKEKGSDEHVALCSILKFFATGWTYWETNVGFYFSSLFISIGLFHSYRKILKLQILQNMTIKISFLQKRIQKRRHK